MCFKALRSHSFASRILCGFWWTLFSLHPPVCIFVLRSTIGNVSLKKFQGVSGSCWTLVTLLFSRARAYGFCWRLEVASAEWWGNKIYRGCFIPFLVSSETNWKRSVRYVRCTSLKQTLSGAILRATDQSAGCPEGWATFENAASNFIRNCLLENSFIVTTGLDLRQFPEVLLSRSQLSWDHRFLVGLIDLRFLVCFGEV